MPRPIGRSTPLTLYRQISRIPSTFRGRVSHANTTNLLGTRNSSTVEMHNRPLWEVDPEVQTLIHQEVRRQEWGLEMIASENHMSLAVLQALLNAMANKYAEGLPNRRWYGGCKYVDAVENLARDRAKRLFGAQAVNVQAHDGSGANMAVYMAIMEPGDTFLGMDLAAGGHLSHGLSRNFSGLLYNPIAYGVNRETELIDYDDLLDKAKRYRPKMIIAGASAYPRNFDYPRFRAIADEVGAVVMADIAHPAGLIAAGLVPSPIDHAQYVTTTTHKTLRGPRGGMILSQDRKRMITVNSCIFPGTQGGPHMHTIAAKAVAFFEALQPSFKVYSQAVMDNAQTLGQALAEGGKLRLVSGGTDTHLLLVDVRQMGLNGKQAEEALGKVGITVNKNGIPFDPEKPAITSGFRIGTPALTTRGMGGNEMRQIGHWIIEALDKPGDEQHLGRIHEQVTDLAMGFPIYPELRVAALRALTGTGAP